MLSFTRLLPCHWLHGLALAVTVFSDMFSVSQRGSREFVWVNESTPGHACFDSGSMFSSHCPVIKSVLFALVQPWHCYTWSEWSLAVLMCIIHMCIMCIIISMCIMNKWMNRERRKTDFLVHFDLLSPWHKMLGSKESLFHCACYTEGAWTSCILPHTLWCGGLHLWLGDCSRLFIEYLILAGFCVLELQSRKE